MQNIIYIKLGGSAITDKTKRKAANLKVINQLAKEIAQARQKIKDLILIAHGQGSFAHVPAKKYRTKEGNISKNSAYGAALVRQECLELNAIVLNALIKAGLPAVTFEPNSLFITNNLKLITTHIEGISIALKSGLIPVVFGDVIPDQKIGWTILSGEQILNALAIKLKSDFKPELIIEVGLTEGVLDENGKTIPQITNYKSVQKLLGGSHGTDVTGGMRLKVEEALTIAKKGIPTILVSLKPGNLTSAITGKNEGTKIL